jgi:hypothetical protein
MLFAERLKLGFEILNRLDPRTKSKSVQPSTATVTQAVKRPTSSSRSLPSLEMLIDEIGPLSSPSIVIGGCDDKAHLFLDLMDPVPGSLLITGDAQSGKTRLLESILTSACLINSPRHVRYAIISSQAKHVDDLAGQPHCYRVAAPDEENAAQLIMELADLAEQRFQYGKADPAVVLAIDDLATLLNGLEDEMIEGLRWLILNGPQANLWTIATLRAEDAATTDPDLLNDFGTRLIGSTASPEMANLLSGDPQAKPGELVKGQQFRVLFDDEWITFWIPRAEEVLA